MPTCGGCFFQGDTTSEGRETKIFCLIHNNYYNALHCCKYYRKYSHNITSNQRIKIAQGIKKQEETQRQKEENLITQKTFGKESRSFNVKLAILTFLFLILATIIGNWVWSLWQKTLLSS